MGFRVYTLKNSVAFVGLVVSVCCTFVVMVSVLKLPDVPLGGNRVFRNRKEVAGGGGDEKLGKFGEMMVEMLPDDLAFTVFVPSERAFQRDLRMNDDSFSRNDTYAVVSRVLGFSAVPRTIYSAAVDDSPVSYDSLSGLTLFISKDREGMLVVNRVPAERVDIRRKKRIVVHVMDGVLMDAEFEQSVRPDDEDDT
ncbi:hypothetical protein LINGRAHAP2_LOCUS25896 [Linum grandiflorum]